MDAALRKQNGIHYTPVGLATFLAQQTVDCLPLDQNEITILDPACGDGQLLDSLIHSIRNRRVKTAGPLAIHVVGFDTDSAATRQTKSRLESLELATLNVYDEDFLLSDDWHAKFDCVIANPPYVRTQVLGGAVAQALATKFQLKGRVDLYQAFAVAISAALNPGGALGLLTSNRFLTVKSGSSMRELLKEKFELKQIFDLGDTRLFEAAVLPVVLTAKRRGRAPDATRETTEDEMPKFIRVYRSENESTLTDRHPMSVLEAVSDELVEGLIETQEGVVVIERGKLQMGSDREAWRLTNPATSQWIQTINANQDFTFGELAEIKVGIKTTADSVFIRDDWETLESSRPEAELLRPLITHHDAARWSIQRPRKVVLYPYEMDASKRTCVDLKRLPQTEAYLTEHRERLERRKYLIDSGRRWYEIWVPHQPADWAKPKIVWPDISAAPRFFLDTTGAIVNGDCYWIKLRPDVDPDWLYMMLAVANSSIATRFYDTMFHNKLYAGRRRFMTQYVKSFPLPALESKLGQQMVELAKQLVASPREFEEAKLSAVVLEAFGF